MTSSILDIIIEPVKRVKRTFYFSQFCSLFFYLFVQPVLLTISNPSLDFYVNFVGKK